MLLSETELRSALEPLLDRLLVERLRLFQLQLEPRLQTLIGDALASRGANPEIHWGELLAANDPNQLFAALFAETQRLVGSARALLVTLRNETAVWRSQDLNLPARFPLAQRAAILRPAPGRASGLHPIRVRGGEVGLLYWEAAATPPAPDLAQLDSLLQIAGALLLSLALPPAELPAAAESAPQEPRAARAAPAASTEPDGPAARFAHLLIEDLKLFLERDQPEKLAEARRRDNLASRFAPELERCRLAFRNRYPSVPVQIFEEAIQRLGD